MSNFVVMSNRNEKCVFCENQGEKILQFNEEKLNKCVEILYSRIKFNLKYNNVKLPDSVNDTDGYHTKCYSNFTSLMAKFRVPNPIWITDSPSTSSPNSPITATQDNITPIVDVNSSFTDNSDLNTCAIEPFNEIPEIEDESAAETSDKLIKTGCFFCEKQQKNVRGNKQILHSSNSEKLYEKLIEWMTKLENDELLKKIHDIKSVGGSVYYHHLCELTFSNNYIKVVKNIPRTLWHTNRDIHKKIFDNIIFLIDEEVIKKKSYLLLSYLCDIYNNSLKHELKQISLTESSYITRQNLENKILKNFPKTIKVVKRNKKKIVLYMERKLSSKRKSETTCATHPKRVSSDELLEGDDIRDQSTYSDGTLFQSKDEYIQWQQTSNRRENPLILKRKTRSISKIQRGQSKDVNSSDVQAKMRYLGKYTVASMEPTSSKLQPVKTSNSSKNAPRIGTQNSQIIIRKSSSNRNIQQNQSMDYMDDEFDTFAKEIAFQLRQLPYYNAKQCQEKIKQIINEESFIVQQSRRQEIETIIIKQEPGFNEEDPLQPVLSQETIQTIIKEEPVTSEDEYPHPVLGYGTIYNENPDISEEEHSHPVSGQGTIQTIIKEEPMLNEYEYPHPISDHGTIQTTLNQNPAISEKELSQPVSSQETINRLKEQLREKMSSSIRSRNNTDYNIYYTPPPETLNKTENFSSDIESVMID